MKANYDYKDETMTVKFVEVVVVIVAVAVDTAFMLPFTKGRISIMAANHNCFQKKKRQGALMEIVKHIIIQLLVPPVSLDMASRIVYTAFMFIMIAADPVMILILKFYLNVKSLE